MNKFGKRTDGNELAETDSGRTKEGKISVAPVEDSFNKYLLLNSSRI